MTPQEREEFNKLKRSVQEIQDILSRFVQNDRFFFDRPVVIRDTNVLFEGVRGVTLGSTTDKFAFYGAVPVDKPATVSDPSGGATVDSQARTAINDLIDRLQELGLIA